MDDETLRQLADTVRRNLDARERSDEELGRLHRTLGELIHVLEAKGVLTKGHVKLLERAGATPADPPTRRVKLAVYGDKYQARSPADLDCVSLLPICHGRCCGMLWFELSAQDVEEGGIRWELDDPYVIRHEADGYCTHQSMGGCTVYEKRPAPCRIYDCRDDKRIWIDFEKKIPAPMPEGLLPPKR